MGGVDMQQFLTLTKLKRRLGLEAVALGAADEARLVMAMRAAEAQVITHTGRRLAPLRGIGRAMVSAYDGDTLITPADMLTLEALTIDGVSISTVVLEVIGGALIRRIDGRDFPVGEAIITGLWAYHHAPESAWRVSGATLTASVNSSATTFSVDSTTGVDAEGESPRLMGGHLVRMGTELLRVTSTTSTTFTAKRGVNGTIASGHTSGALPETFSPDAAAESLGYRWAAWLYREADGDPARAVPDALRADARALMRVGV
jgi:hypothetical protein